MHLMQIQQKSTASCFTGRSLSDSMVIGPLIAIPVYCMKQPRCPVAMQQQWAQSWPSCRPLHQSLQRADIRPRGA